MPRLLVCWELGANFGHLSNIARQRRELSASGLELFFAVADLRAARQILGDGASLLQAPLWSRYVHRGSRVEAATYADVLALIGFGEEARLASVVDAWLELFSLAHPDIILVDHGPAAQLAARILGLKTVTIGTAFTQPPLEYENFPPLRSDIAPAVPETTLLVVANAVLAARGSPRLGNSLPALFAADARIIVGLPELDPYRSFRRDPFAAPAGGFVQPTTSNPRRVFAYLGEEVPNLEEKVQALCSLPCPVEIYVRGADRLLREFIRLRGQTTFDEPAKTSEVLARVSHVISLGGAMFASEALAAGRPHLFMPLHQESRINAAMVSGAGYGVTFAAATSSPDAFTHAVVAFLDDRQLELRTMNFAKLIARRQLPDAGDELMRALGR